MNEQKIIYNLSEDFKEYLKFTNRTINDFYCRKCGKLMIDLNTLEKLYIDRKMHKNIHMKINKLNHGWDTNIKFPRTNENMYLILPKTFTDDIKLFRHTCWDCYLKESWYKPYRYTKNWKNSIPSIGKIREDFSLIFDITTEQIKLLTKQKYTTNSLEHFIKKYGEDIGPIKYQQYKDRQAYTASSEYFIKEKGMSEEQVKMYHKSRGHTLQSDIEKYGEEEGIKKWNEYCKRQAYAGVSLDYFIEKYGEKEGTKKYQQMIDAKSFGCFSPISQQLFKQIKCNESLYGNKELMINNHNKLHYKIYKLDFCNPSTKKVIEFNGVKWHAKPTKYGPNDKIYIRSDVIQLAKDIWKHDQEKLQCIKDQGYDVLVVWEDEYRNNPNLIVEQCKQFLYGE